MENGLRSGWLSLGHQGGVGEVIPMLDASRIERADTKGREGGLSG